MTVTHVRVDWHNSDSLIVQNGVELDSRVRNEIVELIFVASCKLISFLINVTFVKRVFLYLTTRLSRPSCVQFTGSVIEV